MGKSGFWMRGTRGTVGGMTFSRGADGSTIVSVREGQKNPRTRRQMNQRALFATAVKFFKHAVQNVFKFAYEDKTAKESDYNAFMRHNVSRSAIYMYEASKSQTFPAIGNNWLVSVGSLSNPAVDCVNSFGRLKVSGITGSEANWGQISKAIMDEYNLNVGDFVTLVLISSPINNIYGEAAGEAIWDVRQFTIDPNSTMQVGDYFDVESGKFVWGGDATPDDACAAACIFSRVSSNGTKVSTSYLMNNSTANAIYQSSLADSYHAAAIESWKASEAAILQGSISQNKDITPDPSVKYVRGLANSEAGLTTLQDQAVGATLLGKATAPGTYYIQLSGTYLSSLKKEDFQIMDATVTSVNATANKAVVAIQFPDDGTVEGTFSLTAKGMFIANIRYEAPALTFSPSAFTIENKDSVYGVMTKSDGAWSRPFMDSDEIYVDGHKLSNSAPYTYIESVGAYVHMSSVSQPGNIAFEFTSVASPEGSGDIKSVSGTISITKIVFEGKTYLPA